MKILQINAVWEIGSTGRNCKDIADYINTKTGHQCFTATAKGKPEDKGYLISGKSDMKLHGLLSRLSGKQAHFSFNSTQKLLKYIDKIKPDIVHLNNLHGNYINFPLLMKYLAKNNIATVITLHDCWFFTGKCCHYTSVKCNKWMKGCYECPKLKQDNVSWFFDRTAYLWEEKKRLFENISRLGVIGVSDWITGEAQKSFLRCADEIIRIYNWIDLDLFRQTDTSMFKEKYDLQNKYIILGVSSMWDEKKGLDKFIKLASMISDDKVIVLVGKMLQKETLPSNIISAGSTESIHELAEYYSMADAFVTLSLEETFGKVSAEALACGTPVICFDSTANRELIGNGCGRAVKPNDLEGILNAIDELEKCDRDLMKQQCRDYAVKMFSKDTNISEYVSLYERLGDSR